MSSAVLASRLPRRFARATVGMLLGLLCLLVLTPAANAETFCVKPASGCTDKPTTLQDALREAQLRDGRDTLRLGTKEYSYDLAIEDPPGARADLKAGEQAELEAAAAEAVEGDSDDG